MTKMINVKVNGEWDILLPEHRAARPEWTSPGGWEKARLRRINFDVGSFLDQNKEEPVMYYVGAEEGDMCALVQMWGAKLVMFEPNPTVWANIKAIWDANELDKPWMFPGFAGNKTTIEFGAGNLATFMAWPESANGPMISDHGFKNLCEADGTIPIVKIDDMVESGNFRIPDMISIDVEGGEWEVLRGAEQTLRNYMPTIYLSLHPEFLYEIYKEYAGDLRHWLKQMGYKETLLDYQHEVHLVYEGDRSE